MVQISGGINSTILVCELDIEKLRRHRELGGGELNCFKKKEVRFKALPAGFPKEKRE
jgi:hypothetical protein